MAQNNFPPCFTFTVDAEGGYSDDPNDSGNWSSGEVGVGTLIGSRFGISAPTLIDWEGRHGGVEVTAYYMQNLPLYTAKTIYMARYWNVVNGESLPLGVDLAVWDFGVNAGCRVSAKELQTVVGAEPDGVIGPRTLYRVGQFWTGPAGLIESLITAHDRFYKSLDDPEYLAGWLERQDRVRTTALAMASATT